MKSKTTYIIKGAICIAITFTVGLSTSLQPEIHIVAVKQFLTKTNNVMLVSNKDKECLAKNIYYEAGIEHIHGKYAVAQVTLNRLKSGHWGNNICSVVYAKSQFSWTISKVKKGKKYYHKKLAVPTGTHWEESKQVANTMLNGARVDSLRQSLFYHATYVSPNWVEQSAYVAQIGKHLFYSKGRGNSITING